METKKEIVNKTNHLFSVCSGTWGIIIAIYINQYLIFPFFMIFGFIGYLLRPYNKNGENRY